MKQMKKITELKTADIYVTAMNTDERLSGKEPLQFKDQSQQSESFPAIFIDIDKTYQTIEGFGGALTDATAETFYKLPQEKQEKILTACFSEKEGNGYTLCRTNINSCDFSSQSYVYAEVEDDIKLEHYTIDHDKKYRIPLIKEAINKSGNKLNIFASPWSPPAWMKTNNDMLYGGKLKPEYFSTWANYFVRFIKEYKKNGISIWGITVQNETLAVQRWESCIYSAEEERDFVKNYLGPVLKESGLSDVKIIVWDHNRDLMFPRAKTIFDDLGAAKYVWGTGFHWYNGNNFENVRIVHDAFPDKCLLFTEGCIENFQWNKIMEWQHGEKYGESIIHDLNNWAVGWVDWNILLDETGGPNHVNNFCYAPIIGDRRNGDLHFMNTYYYIGHFSRFIKSGAKRIACSSGDDDLHATAFLNADGKVAAVVLNKTEEDKVFQLWIENKTLNYTMKPHSIITLVFNV